MIPKHQTRPDNCFPACIASILEMEVDDIIQIQEHYDESNWYEILQQWLNKMGYMYRMLTESDNILDRYIIVIGLSPRNTDSKSTHAVVYFNGDIIHDPHPDNTGILDERTFIIIEQYNEKTASCQRQTS